MEPSSNASTAVVERRGLDAKALGALLAEVHGSEASAAIEELSLESCKLGKKNIEALAATLVARPSIRRLRLPSCGINAGSLEAIASALPPGRVDVLDLRGNPLGDAGVTFLASAPAFSGLREIDVSFTRLKHAGLQALVEGPSLAALERWTSGADKIGAYGARILAKAPWKLTRFCAFRQNLGAEGVAYLALEGPETLRELVLFEVGVGPVAVEAIASSKRVTRLQVLRFRYDNVNDAAIATIAAAKSLSGLEHFQASQCKIGPEGVRALARSPHLVNLRTLDLGANRRIGIDGARILAGAPNLAELRSLDVSSTPLGPDGVAELLSGSWPALEALNLSWCDIGDEGLLRLSEWPGLARIRHLGLGTNALGKEALARFADHPSTAGIEWISVIQNPCADEAPAIFAGARYLRPKTVGGLAFTP